MDSDSPSFADELAHSIAVSREKEEAEALQAAAYALSQESLPKVVTAELAEIVEALQTSEVEPTIFYEVRYETHWFSDDTWKVVPRFEAWECRGVLISTDGRFGHEAGVWGRVDTSDSMKRLQPALDQVVPKGRKYKHAIASESAPLHFKPTEIGQGGLRLDDNGEAEIEVISGEDHYWHSLKGWLRGQALFLAGVSTYNHYWASI